MLTREPSCAAVEAVLDAGRDRRRSATTRAARSPTSAPGIATGRGCGRRRPLANGSRIPWGGSLLTDAAGGIRWAPLYGCRYALGDDIYRLCGPIGAVFV